MVYGMPKEAVKLSAVARAVSLTHIPIAAGVRDDLDLASQARHPFSHHRRDH